MVNLVSPTVQRLLTEVRIFLNQREATNSFWKDDELSLYINDGIATFFLETSEHAEGQFDVSTTLDVVGGQEAVALPSDFFAIKKLFATWSDRFQILEYRNDVTQSYTTELNNSSGTYYPCYFFRGNSIILRPIPGFSQTGYLKLEYTALPQGLVAGSDPLVSGINPIYKELIVLHAAYKAKVREDLTNNSNTSAKVAALLSDSYAKFKETLGYRSKYPQFIIPFTP